MEWTRRSPCSRGSCPVTSPDMGTSAGVVNGASAGADINHKIPAPASGVADDANADDNGGMTRRRRSRSRTRRALDSEFAKPLFGLVLLGLLWLAYQIGLLAWVAEIPINILRSGLLPES